MECGTPYTKFWRLRYIRCAGHLVGINHPELISRHLTRRTLVLYASHRHLEKHGMPVPGSALARTRAKLRRLPGHARSDLDLSARVRAAADAIIASVPAKGAAVKSFSGA